ncbi:MAG TPA: hypothetical protein VKL21_04150 [Candidatus Methanoperedens sp.]|nr:hypothetical protein [Candidatus Methanoperedens sp.]
MSEDTEYLRRIYPENFPSATLIGWIIAVLVFSLIFLIPYFYARFVEPVLVSFICDRMIPFLMVRLHLQKPIGFINHILNIRIFKPRNGEHA